MISEQEREIMRQAYRFLAAHCTPPINDEENAADWWIEAVREMTEMIRAWQSDPLEHKLMEQQLMAIFDYLEEKARVATEKARAVAE